MLEAALVAAHAAAAKEEVPASMSVARQCKHALQLLTPLLPLLFWRVGPRRAVLVVPLALVVLASRLEGCDGRVSPLTNLCPSAVGYWFLLSAVGGWGWVVRLVGQRRAASTPLTNVRV
jgi:hypothetical protein